MTDTPETLQAALADLRDRHNEAMKSLAKWTIDVDSAIARVAAFEKAQKEEPPALDDDEYVYLVPTKYKDHEMPPNATTRRKAAARLRWCEAELARLREGLKVQGDDVDGAVIERACAFPREYGYGCMAREIQRHRALVSP